jgi:hypothetical protein
VPAVGITPPLTHGTSARSVGSSMKKLHPSAALWKGPRTSEIDTPRQLAQQRHVGSWVKTRSDPPTIKMALMTRADIGSTQPVVIELLVPHPSPRFPSRPQARLNTRSLAGFGGPPVSVAVCALTARSRAKTCVRSWVLKGDIASFTGNRFHPLASSQMASITPRASTVYSFSQNRFSTV